MASAGLSIYGAGNVGRCWCGECFRDLLLVWESIGVTSVGAANAGVASTGMKSASVGVIVRRVLA